MSFEELNSKTMILILRFFTAILRENISLLQCIERSYGGYVRRTQENSKCSQDTTIFDDYYPYLEHSQLVGGTQKSVLFWGPEGRISFETVPLQHVVEGLRQYFRRYYIFHVYDTEMDGIRKSGPEMLKIFDEALANLDWPADDACKDLFAPASTSAS